MNKTLFARFAVLAVTIVTPALFHGGLFAVTPTNPTASTVPFVATNPTSPHTSWSGNAVTLKGTMSSPLLGTDTFTWDFNPGDGGPHCTGTIDTAYQISGATDNPYVLACSHTYTGSVGTLYTAVLTVTDTTNSTVAPPVNCPPSITSGACYYTQLYAPPPNLAIEVNNAIDNGLWYLHTEMQRLTAGNGASIGNWYSGNSGNASSYNAGGTGVDSSNCAAFENSGFLQTTVPVNPYSDDVARCVANTFDQLTQISISSFTPYGFSAFNPDSNGNGVAVEHNGYPENYQTGMMLDAIAAAGTPGTTVPAGTALGASPPSGGTGPNGAYTYKDAMFDMVDAYAYCQNPGQAYNGFSSYPAGGWHYSCQELTGDNSVSQWAAIGIIPARRKVGLPAGVDPLSNEVLATDQSWLASSFTSASTSNGYFGYTSNSPLWGPYADTPSGLVQLAMSGLGRGTTLDGTNLWDSAETYLRDNFALTGTDPNWGYNALKDYYYGLYSFTKSMLLHDNNDTGFSALPSPSGTTAYGSAAGLNTIPITLLQSSDDPGTCKLPVPEYTSTPGDSGPGTGSGACYPPIDWYGAQSAAYGGTDPTEGVARTLVSTQNADGSWFGHNVTSSQYYLETGIAVTMLNKTVFQPVPVACFTTNPSHVASGGPVVLDGGCSVDQNPDNHLVSWQWDIDGTGGTTFTVGPGSPQCLTPSCSKMVADFTLPAGQSLPYNYPVRLRVADSATPALTADVVGDVVIANPPNPPNANAGGPYNFCPNTSVSGALIYSPFLLDGSRSTNPDQGKTDGTPGATPSTIVSYLWDYSCSGAFTSASGSQVNATTAFDVPADFGTSFNVCLQVTNNDNLAFPTAGLANGLSSVASAQVSIHNTSDEVCTHCISNLTSKIQAQTPSVAGNIQLYWTDTNTSTQFTIDHYNVYRSTSSSFSPFTQIAGANSSPFIPAVKVSSPAGGLVYFQDTNVTGGMTYYYRVAPATVNDTETCQGNVTLSATLPKGR